MNYRLKFLLPRIAGLALIAGIASLLLMIVFKILLAVLAIAGFVILIRAVTEYFIRHKDAFLIPEYRQEQKNAAITPFGEKENWAPAAKTIVPIL